MKEELSIENRTALAKYRFQHAQETLAEVSFLKSEQNSNTYIIPANIVQIDEQNRTFVWVVQNNKAHRRIISCGEYTAEGVNVVSGLSEGDKIITKGQQKVCEGTEVSL